MKGRILEILLWLISAAAIALIVIQMPSLSVTDNEPVPAAATEAADTSHRADLSVAAEMTIARDVFRLERRPADVAYGFDQTARIEISEGWDVSVLRLTGVIGGPPWQAVIDGMPGRDTGVLVNNGDTVGDLRIVRISADSLTLQQGDMMWTIGMVNRWRD